MSIIKKLQDVLLENEPSPTEEWQLRMISSGDCLSYFSWNEKTKEALLVDPKKDDLGAYMSLKSSLDNYLWIGVIDTHTHADHISAASQMAEALNAPLIMHVSSPSSRIHIRIAKQTSLSTQAGKLQFIPTPGHTPDGICVSWGPFLFTGDTVLYSDVGRDDLPSGNPETHYESLSSLKLALENNASILVLPGHDNKGGRITSWATQLKINSSLIQSKDSYVEESLAFEGSAPALLKKSLYENFK